MKEPKSKLPWKLRADTLENEEGVSIIWGDRYGSGEIEGETEDLEYILQACNNFPKAIQFLKDTRNYYNPSNIEMIDEFLKEIENV